MTAPFNPLAGNFSTAQWIAPLGDYNLKIGGVSYREVEAQGAKKDILTFTLYIVGGEFDGKKTADLTVWEPQKDFAQAGRIIVAAMGYEPGKEDGKFVAENPGLDLTLALEPDEETGENKGVLGQGYEQLVGSIFTATLDSKVSKSNGNTYQNFKSIRPLVG